MNPFHNRAAETSSMVDPPTLRRTSGSVICPACNKEYRRHADSEHRDFNDDPFLKRLCSGELVKL